MLSGIPLADIYSQLGGTPKAGQGIGEAQVFPKTQNNSGNYTLTTWNYSRNITQIRDADYYKRLDEIAQQKFDAELRMYEKGTEYFEKKDFESALFYFKKIENFDSKLNFELYQDRYLFIFLCWVNINDNLSEIKGA